jgi:hypothetical protein
MSTIGRSYAVPLVCTMCTQTFSSKVTLFAHLIEGHQEDEDVLGWTTQSLTGRLK